MKPSLRHFLEREVAVFHLCTLSIAEICFKWRRGRLPGVPDPIEWLEHSLQHFVLIAPSASACRQLVFGIGLTAIAVERRLPLIHTDSTLKDISGFPQKYFPNAG